MSPDYTFTMGGDRLDLEQYLEMVEDALGRFTDLRIAVDEIVLGPDRLAMAFRETTTSPRTGRLATWRGVALYEFDEAGLLSAARVEQDFWGRRSRFRGEGFDLDPGLTDEAVWSQQPLDPIPTDDVARAVGQLQGPEIEFDDGAGPWLDIDRVEIVDAVSAGRRVAVRIHIEGGYRPVADGPRLQLSAGEPLTTTATGIATIDDDDTMSAGRFVSDRFGIWMRYRAAT